MTEKGLLLPDVNEYLYELNEAAILNESTVMKHARSGSAWQIQSQVWALDQIIRESAQE